MINGTREGGGQGRVVLDGDSHLLPSNILFMSEVHALGR